MSKQRIATGKSGEEAAAAFLEKNGYTVLERNFRTRLGEIDIVAREKDVLCFIEVKARKSEAFGLPQEALTPAKQGQIIKTALAYLKIKRLFDCKARFDVVWVQLFRDQTKIGVIKNAFGLPC